MTIKVSGQQVEDEREHGEELVLVSVTYTGQHQLYTDNAIRTQGYWPSYSGFTRGVTEVALLPDRGLGYFENRNDFEVDYSAEAIAKALLERNYLAPEVFTGGVSTGETRDRVLEKLGIQRLETTTEGIREQLREVAGLSEDEAPDSTERTLADKLAHPDDGYKRSELKDAASRLRDDADDVSLNSNKVEFAEWLAGLVESGEMTQGELKREIENGGD